MDCNSNSKKRWTAIRDSRGRATLGQAGAVAPASVARAPAPNLLLRQPCRAPAASSPVRTPWGRRRGGCLADKAVVLIGPLATIRSSRQQQPKIKKDGPSLSLWCNRFNPHHPLPPLKLHMQHPSAQHWRRRRRSRWLDGACCSSASVWQPERLWVAVHRHEGRRGRVCRGWAWSRLLQQRNQGSRAGAAPARIGIERASKGEAKVPPWPRPKTVMVS
jgi:hypothetical protein